MNEQKKPKPGLSDLVSKAESYGQKLKPYSLLIFLVFTAILYGSVLLKINELSSTEPSQASVDEQVKSAKVPQIDEAVVQQLKTLQDNSVSVQTLFTEARQNPFE